MSARAAAVQALLALALLAWPVGAPAASFALGQTERTEALRVGRRSTTSDTFDAEWRVANPSGESVMVVTPFHRLVVAARHAAFRNERMKPDEPDKLLREQQDRLVIWAYLRGQREDFARFYAARLVLREREIEPAFVQNERTSLRQEGGTFLARSVYGFPNKELTPTSKVVLVVRDPDGGLITRFSVDLAKIR